MADPSTRQSVAARLGSVAVAGAVVFTIAACAEQTNHGGRLVADAAGDTTRTEPAAHAGAGSPADGFYVVSAVDTAPCDPPERPDRPNESCYTLGGEPAFGLDAVASAEPTRPPNGPWLVELMLTDDGLAAFNRAARVCFERQPPCITGLFALVIDGTVVTAPSIEAHTYDHDSISVADLTQAEAHSLAETLTD